MAFSDPVKTPATGTALIDRLHWGMHWSDGDSNGTTQLAVYIAGLNGQEEFDYGGRPLRAETTPEEAAAYRTAMALFEKICNVDFVEVNSQQDADIILSVTGPKPLDGSLGETVTPGGDKGPLHDMQGAVIINREGYSGKNYAGLQVGGYDFITFIHELGHAVGLKHPHDTGGGVFPRFPKVFKEFGQLGKYALNQGINTMMTYNDGWVTGPLGKQHSTDHPESGWQTLMALDIAALQDLYGANTSTGGGDDTYVLPASNAPGTFFSGIWDAGGLDEIAAAGKRACVIDLRPASLKIERDGGGHVSYQNGVFGGFTIANGVVIENATGSASHDSLIGNDADNVLTGLGGADTLIGGRGADTLTGGMGRDVFVYKTEDVRRQGGTDTITDFTHADTIDLRDIDGNGRNKAGNSFHFIGDDAFSRRAGELRFEKDAGHGATFVEADINGDGVADFSIVLTGLKTLAAGDFLL